MRFTVNLSEAELVCLNRNTLYELQTFFSRVRSDGYAKKK